MLDVLLETRMVLWSAVQPRTLSLHRVAERLGSKLEDGIRQRVLALNLQCCCQFCHFPDRLLHTAHALGQPILSET